MIDTKQRLISPQATNSRLLTAVRRSLSVLLPLERLDSSMYKQFVSTFIAEERNMK